MEAYTKKGARKVKVPIVTGKKRHPVIVVDCSKWSQYLEVVASADRDCSARSRSALVTKIGKLIDDLDTADRGTGFRNFDVQIDGRDIIAAFAPIEPDRAEERITRICEMLNHLDRAANCLNGINKLAAHAV